MKSWAWAAVGLLIGAGSVMGSACGGSSGSGGGGGTNAGGGGGNGGSTVTVNPTQSTSTTGTGGTMDCGVLGEGMLTPLNPAMTAAACGTCISSKCCAAAKACDQGTDCGNLIACYQGQTMSSTACDSMFTTGKADYTAFNSCLGGACEADCGSLACLSDLVRPQPRSATDTNTQLCSQCLGEKCCASWTAVSDDYLAQNCMTDTSCAILTDLSACEADLTAANCKSDAHALAAATCELQTCGVGGDPSKTDAFCPVPVCASGIVISGGGTCATCLGTNCCDQFTAFDCTDPNSSDPTSQCSVDLAALGDCTMADMTCKGNADAAALATCQDAHCKQQCGDAFSGSGTGGSGGGN